jgi:hypothetical protein
MLINRLIDTIRTIERESRWVRMVVGTVVVVAWWVEGVVIIGWLAWKAMELIKTTV